MVAVTPGRAEGSPALDERAAGAVDAADGDCGAVRGGADMLAGSQKRDQPVHGYGCPSHPLHMPQEEEGKGEVSMMAAPLCQPSTCGLASAKAGRTGFVAAPAPPAEEAKADAMSVVDSACVVGVAVVGGAVVVAAAAAADYEDRGTVRMEEPPLGGATLSNLSVVETA